MPTATTLRKTIKTRPDAIPDIETGDRLTHEEFMRRYQAAPHINKAERIEGMVYMPSPVNPEKRGTPQAIAMTWLGVYWSGTPGITLADNSTIHLDLDNDPQPDAFLAIDPDRGGQARYNENGYLVGAPELIVEITASSASYDLHDKFHVYRRNGVREYVVWRVIDEDVDWFILRDGKYERLDVDASGLYRSEVFPGLWLDPAALIQRDLATVLHRLEEGLASGAHQAFIEQLAAR